MKTLIIGCGDTGIRVAARAVAAGDLVTGVVRTAASGMQVRAVGAHSLICDLDAELPPLPACERLLYFAPPPRKGDSDPRLQQVLDALGTAPRFVVYISTTGVYGDCGGAWIDEEQALAPATARARRRVAAEQQLLAWCKHAVILRTPGIYGPGRLPLAAIRAGQPILSDAASGWTNRVHVDDLAAIAWQAGQQHWPHAIYHASDGQPTRMSRFYDTLAAMLALPAPPRVDWAAAQQQFSRTRLSFLRASRRLSNARLRQDFGYQFKFVDFRDGLAASLRAEPPAVQGTSSGG
ncbi:MAG TPA: SDR family oxidoreductase [Salinisphaeraceae bacterium]|nr:SDR family oxidoreductase [Salinisphaeraceae bacterium]